MKHQVTAWSQEIVNFIIFFLCQRGLDSVVKIGIVIDITGTIPFLNQMFVERSATIHGRGGGLGGLDPQNSKYPTQTLARLGASAKF